MKEKKIKIELTDEEWKYVWQAVILALGRAGELKALRKNQEWNEDEFMYIRLRDKIWEQMDKKGIKKEL